MSSITKMRAPAVIAVASAASAMEAHSERAPDDEFAHIGSTAGHSPQDHAVVEETYHGSKSLSSGSSWTQLSTGGGLSSEHIEEASKVIFSRDADVGISSARGGALDRHGARQGGGNQHLSLMISFGTELAKDPRVQQSVAERLGCSTMASILPSPEKSPAPASSTAPVEDGADDSDGGSNPSFIMDNVYGTEEDDGTPEVVQSGEHATIQALMQEIKELKAQVVKLQDDLTFQEDMNQHLLYQNCQLQDSLDKKSERSNATPLSPERTASEKPGTDPDRGSHSRVAGSSEVPPSNSASGGEPPDGGDQGWWAEQTLLHGALGIAASIILIAVLRQHGSRHVHTLAAAVVSAAGAVANSVGRSRQA